MSGKRGGKKADARQNPIFLGRKYEVPQDVQEEDGYIRDVKVAKFMHFCRTISNIEELKKIQEWQKKKDLYSNVTKGNFREVEILLSKGHPVDDLYEDHETLLHVASREAHSQITQLLIKLGAKLDCRNCDGFVPLHVAIINGRLEIVKLLIKASYFEGKYALIDVRSNSPYSLNYTPLHLAAKFGYDEIIDFLINFGADLDNKVTHADLIDATTPLCVAVHYIWKKCVRVLLKYSGYLGDVREYRNIIYYAANGTSLHYNGKFLMNSEEEDLSCAEIIDNLLEAGAKLRCNRATDLNALIIAAKRNRYWVVKKLLKHGFKVNSRDHKKRTALHLACKYASHKVVRILLDAGASLTEKDTHGNLPIHYVAYGKNREVLPTLINAGANINAKTPAGRTVYQCLAQAFEKNNPEHLKCFYTFVQYGFDLNDKDISNNTALHFLTDYYTDNCPTFIIDKFLDFNVNNEFGETPLKSAIIKDERKVQIFIVKAMIKMECEQKFKINETNMLLIRKKFPILYEKCKSELEILKNEKFWDTITFYDILNRPIDILREYTLNTEFMQVFNSHGWNSFPEYSKMIRDRIMCALECRKNFEKSVNTLNNLLYPILVPRHITRDIVSFLYEKDLITLSSII